MIENSSMFHTPHQKIAVLGSPIIAGNFGELIFANNFRFYDNLKLEIVALTSPKDVKTGARRKRLEHGRIDLVPDRTVLWEVTFKLAKGENQPEEYTIEVRRMRECTKTSEACHGELIFMGKPKNQKSFRGQKLRKGSFIPKLDNLGFRCNCTSSLRKGHHRTEAYCWAKGEELISNCFVIRGRPTGSKRPRPEVILPASYSKVNMPASYQFSFDCKYEKGEDPHNPHSHHAYADRFQSPVHMVSPAPETHGHMHPQLHPQYEAEAYGHRGVKIARKMNPPMGAMENGMPAPYREYAGGSRRPSQTIPTIAGPQMMRRPSTPMGTPQVVEEGYSVPSERPIAPRGSGDDGNYHDMKPAYVEPHRRERPPVEEYHAGMHPHPHHLPVQRDERYGYAPSEYGYRRHFEESPIPQHGIPNGRDMNNMNDREAPYRVPSEYGPHHDEMMNRQMEMQRHTVEAQRQQELYRMQEQRMQKQKASQAHEAMKARAIYHAQQMEAEARLKAQAHAEVEARLKARQQIANSYAFENERRSRLKAMEDTHTQLSHRRQSPHQPNAAHHATAPAPSESFPSDTEVPSYARHEKSPHTASRTTSYTSNTSPVAEAPVEAKVEVAPEVPPEVVPKNKVEAKSEIKAEIKAEVKADVETEGSMATQDKTVTEIKTEVKNEVKPEMKAEIEKTEKEKTETESSLPSPVPASASASTSGSISGSTTLPPSSETEKPKIITDPKDPNFNVQDAAGVLLSLC
eukprot:Nk52_evm52s745 gene=Nk52_evmTU52s745